MSIFASPRTFYGPADASFAPLFRFLNDFESYSREVQDTNGNNGRGGQNQLRSARTFNPRFDVRETETAYELHGELPGIERDQVELEFTDPQTLVVRGRVERSYTAGTPPAGLLEGGDGANKKGITEAGEQSAKASKTDNNSTDNNTTADNAEHAPADSPADKAAAAKFWVAERSVGQFSRTFSLPARVDQEAVTASLNNGVLTVVVPKAKKQEARRIAIN